MAWWVYKCNSRNREHQRAYGDWDEFLADPKEHWGKSEWVPELARLKVGDYIIAYQTNRNEIVGLTRVRQSCEQDGCLYLTPLTKRIGVKVRPLKKDPAIDSIKAFQPGPIHTIYSVTKEEAERLLEAIGGTLGPPPSEPEPEEGFEEGGKRSATSTLRNPKLREEAKREYGLNCYCCGFKFEEFYGSMAQGRAIVHHLETFRGDPSKQRVSTVDDVRVVCANCHYVIHLTEDPLDVDDLKRMIEQSWTRWDQGGVSRTVSLARSRGARPASG
jgi:hypothetical protein